MSDFEHTVAMSFFHISIPFFFGCFATALKGPALNLRPRGVQRHIQGRAAEMGLKISLMV